VLTDCVARSGYDSALGQLLDLYANIASSSSKLLTAYKRSDRSCRRCWTSAISNKIMLGRHFGAFLHEQGLGELYITVLVKAREQYLDNAAVTGKSVGLRRNNNKEASNDVLDGRARLAQIVKMEELKFDDEYMQWKGR
jgi:hypothetical protein